MALYGHPKLKVVETNPGIQKDIAATSAEKQRNGIYVYPNPQTAKKERKSTGEFKSPNGNSQGYIDQKSTGKAKCFESLIPNTPCAMMGKLFLSVSF